jgi:hypothetical protein
MVLVLHHEAFLRRRRHADYLLAAWLPGGDDDRGFFRILAGDESTQHKTAVSFSFLITDKVLLLLRNSRDVRFLYLSFQEGFPSHCQWQIDCLVADDWVRFVIGSSRIHVCL